MEPVLIGVVIIIAVVLLLVLAFLLFNKEQSFEDAVAQQKASHETLIESKSITVKVARQRKKPKKEKTRNEDEIRHVKNTKEADLPADVSATSDEVHDEEIAKTFFEVTESSPEKSSGNAESSEEEKPAPKVTKRKAKDKKKHVEVVSQKEQEPAPREVVTEKVVVDDVIEKLESEAVYESAPPLSSDNDSVPQKPPTTDASAINASKKSKKSKGSKDKNLTADALDVESIVITLENSSLDNNEIQRLVDLLLDKQKSAQQWKTPGSKPDPMEILRKQLAEKEAAYEEEHTRAESLTAKTKEIRDELNQEKLKYKSTENNAAQKIKVLEKENQALQMRMTASHSNHAQENQSLRAALEQCKKNHGQLDWRQLQEELASSKELVHRTNNEKAELEARLSSFENDIGTRSDKENILLKQVAETNERLVNSEAVKKSLSQQLQESIKGKSESEQRLEIAKKELQTAQAGQTEAGNKVEGFKTQLDTERTKKVELERMFKALELKHKEDNEKSTKEKDDLVQKLHSATKSKNDDTQLAELQKHLAEVSKQLESLRTQLAQAEQYYDRTKEDLTVKTEQLGKNEGEMKSLKESNSSKDEEIDSLKKQLSVRESEVVVMQPTVTEDLQAAPDFDDGRLTELEEEVEKLKTELEEGKETIEKLEKSSETAKAKNNELREKNWKAMDAISSAEKSRHAEIGKAVASIKEENRQAMEKYRNDIKTYLCTIHPTISMDKELPYERFLKEYENQTKELGCGTPVDNTKVDELEAKLAESLKKTQDLDGQCDKYKSTLAATENMLRELERNVEDEIATLKETLKDKDAELQKTNASVSELDDKLKKVDEQSKTKDDRISVLEKDLADKESLLANASDSDKLASSVEELKESLRKAEEDSHSKDAKITTLEKEISNKDGDLNKLNSSLKDVQDSLRKSEEDSKSKATKITSLESQVKTKNTDLEKADVSIGELEKNAQKASADSKSKDTTISSLEKELSALKKSNDDSNSSSQNELKKLSENLELIKKQEESLRAELGEAKKEASKSREENVSPSASEVEKCKKDAQDASKVNAELRKELEEVRLQFGELQSSSSSSSQKKKHKEDTEKMKLLEEKLASAGKKESELNAKIAALEESKSMNSVDEDAPGSPEKKKKGKGFSLLGSKSSKYEGKYKDMTEKYEQAKTESDEKSSKIAELETKLQQSEKALETQDVKVKELSDSLKKAQDGIITNGGVQNTATPKPLNENQMKQMAEAMKDGDSSGGAV